MAHQNDVITDNNESTKVTLFGAAANLILVIFKFIAGIFGNSAAMVADAAHSLSDLISDAVVLVGLKISAKPKDETHQYGHGKVETSAAVFVGLMLAGAGFYIFWEGAEGLIMGVQTQPTTLALAAAIISIIVKEGLYRITVRVGRRQKKPLLIANAWHHRTDALSSIAALIGIGGSMLVGVTGERFGLEHLDQIAGIAVSLFVIRAGFVISWESYKDLVDTAIDDKFYEKIKQTIEDTEGVCSVHKLRSRKVGQAIFVDMHVMVYEELNIKQAHDIADEVEQTLINDLQVDDVTVHIEGYECKDPDDCRHQKCPAKEN